MEQIKRDLPEKPAETKRKLSMRRKLGIMATAAVFAAGIGKTTWDSFNKSGEHILYQPANPTRLDITNQLSVDTWNMHDEAAAKSNQMQKILHNSSVLALQEVNTDDAEILSKKLKHVYITYALGDKKQQALEGGYGNALITKQKPTDIETRSISGTSFIKSALGAIAGFYDDISVDVANASTNTSLHQTKEGIQENRVALAETIKIKDGLELQDLRIITSHLSGADQVSYIFGEDPVEADQRVKLGEFIKSELKEGRPTLFMGDLNAGPDVIVPWFENMGFNVLKTPPTSSNTHRRIDYIAINQDGINQPLSFEEARRLKFQTDHYAVQADFVFGLSKYANFQYPEIPSDKSSAQYELGNQIQSPVIDFPSEFNRS